MSSVNSTGGFVNLPAQIIATGTETTLLVPAQGAYAGLPSPTLAIGKGLFIGVNPDIAGSWFDGHPFVVSLYGLVTTGGSITFKPTLYQVPGTIASAGTSSTVANDHAVFIGAATTVATATVNFAIQVQFLWDSTSKILNGFVSTYQINGVNIATGTPSGTAGQMQVTTQVTTVGIGDLNFIPSFTFGTANAANAVQVTEIVIDRA